jgi:DUF1009 family protein
MAEKLGIIAGNGSFPLILAENARREGYEIVACALREEADPAIEKLVHRVHWISITQLGTLIKVFQMEGVRRAVMAGQVIKRRMYLSDLLKLDMVAARLWASLPDRRGDTILRAVANELAKNGITLEDSTLFMGPYLATPGIMAGKPLTPAEQADVEFGYRMAKVIAEHDIGQSVAVKDLSVVAVEAVEGTDACIRRAGELAGPGFALVKVSQKNHDMRFDVPVVGVRTVESMKAAGGRVLAVEAGRTLMLEKDDFLAAATADGLSVLGV